MSQLNEKTLLQVSDLKVSYGPIQAVKGINFDVYKGEIVSLIGANGAGKSSVLRALSQLIPSSGHIEFQTQKVSKLAPHRLVEKGLVHSPEGRGIFLNLSVLENLRLGAYTRSDSQSINQDLEICFSYFPRLKERLKASAGTLSGGEQQMLALSRALMARPKLLLLDEPSLGLAPLIVRQIFQIIESINRDGVTLLLVEQNARQALKISHRAYVLETGNIVLHGTGQELLNNQQIQSAYLGH